MYLGAPPVRLWASAARTANAVRLRGVHSYSMGAGGFGTVPAMPQLQAFPRRPNVPVTRDVRLVELYSQQPGLFKQRLARQFADPAAAARAGFGYQPPVPALAVTPRPAGAP
jgi:hypothetical protein